MPTISRIIVAGLSGGSGKTIATLGLCRAAAGLGRRVKPFKKGPDYIDAAWLGLAAGNPAVNLDPFIIPGEKLAPLFIEKSEGFDLSLIEGNRGLFDGKDVHGSCSTSELARILDIPVILVMDCTKMTRTAAAVVHGMSTFEPGMRLAGVILNRTAGERHRSILEKTIREYTDVEVLGALPKLVENPIPERHMGLVSDREHDMRDSALDQLGETLGKYLDVQRILEIADTAPELPQPAEPLWDVPAQEKTVRLGYVRDAALWFYYPENLEALERAGAELVELSLLTDKPWPKLHGLYLGGGFPETQARALSANSGARERVRMMAEAGMPVYAECGGFMYLCETLDVHGTKYPMSGVFPLTTTLMEKPQGLGYTEAETCMDTPYYPAGTRLRGHEFHYSKCTVCPDRELSFALDVKRGRGIVSGRDGLVFRNVMAGYKHTHALGTPEWAPNFVRAACEYKAALGAST